MSVLGPLCLAFLGAGGLDVGALVAIAEEDELLAIMLDRVAGPEVSGRGFVRFARMKSKLGHTVAELLRFVIDILT